MKSNVIIGVVAHEKNEHDSKTLKAALASANKHRTKPIVEAICDREYRGKKEVDGTTICIPDSPKKRDTKHPCACTLFEKKNKSERNSETGCH